MSIAIDTPARGPAAPPSAPGALPHRYVPQLDALRALAVTAVLIYHLDGRWLPGGFAGVDVFFVLSGYVVSGSLADFPPARLRSLALRFYSRRVLRILPALLACLMATALASVLFVPKAWLSDGSRWTVVFGMLGLSNVALMNGGDPYFSPRGEYNTATHTWSLGVEEQFYLVFPFVFFGWLMARRRAPERRASPSAWLTAFVLLSFGYSAFASAQNPVAAYYAMPSRFWELGAGALLLQLHRGGRGLTGSWASPALVVSAAAALLAVGLTQSRASGFPVPWALCTVAGSLLFIDAVMSPRGARSRWTAALGWKPLAAVGRVSYSLYLWHWPVLVLMRWTSGVEGGAERGIAAALTIALALASYRFLERPVRSSRVLLNARPGVVVAGGVALALGAAAASLALFLAQPWLSLSVTRDVRSWYEGDWPSPPPGCKPTKQTLSLGQGLHTRLAGCGADTAAAATRTVFVLGDSHSTALEPMLRQAVLTRPVKVELLTQPGCGLFDAREPSRAECIAFARQATEVVQRQARPGDVILLSSLRLPRFGDQWASFDESAVLDASFGAEAVRRRRAAVEEIDAWLAGIARTGAQVVLTAPTPMFRSPAYRCSDWFNRANPICAGGLTMPRELLERVRAPALDALNGLAARHPRVMLWDSFSLLCPGANCAAVRDGRPLFIDGDHLSGHANTLLYPGFMRLLDGAAAAPG